LILGPRRLALIGAIAAVALTIIFYPLLVATPFDPNDVSILLGGVRQISGGEEEQRIDLEVLFNMSNTSGYTLTTSKIEYELFADGESVGSDTLSYENVPINGRPALFSDDPPIALRDTFRLDYSDQRAELFNKILNSSEEISWSVTGVAIIESGTTFQERPFSSEL
jgi:hypothetical protein